MLDALIVDDSKAELDVIIYLTKKYNLPLVTTTACNGEEAYEYLQKHFIHLLITDIKMPFMNGLELAEKALDIYPNLKIVISSGYQDFSYAKTAISLGVEEYLLKPIHPKEFTDLILKITKEIEKEQAGPTYEALALKENEFVDLDSLSGKVRFVCSYISSHYQEDLSLESLAIIACVHPDYLSRIFKKETGMNLNRYIKIFRMNKACNLLETTQQKITLISSFVGYQNCAYFIRSFTEIYGMSPEKYRQQFYANIGGNST